MNAKTNAEVTNTMPPVASNSDSTTIKVDTAKSKINKEVEAVVESNEKASNIEMQDIVLKEQKVGAAEVPQKKNEEENGERTSKEQRLQKSDYFESSFIFETRSLELSFVNSFTKAVIFPFQNVKTRLGSKRLICSNETSKEVSLNDQFYVFNPVLAFDFDQVSAKVYYSELTSVLSIHILGCDICFKLKGQNEILQKFMLYLNYYISDSKGGKENLMGVSLRKDFYKKYFISSIEFEERAKSGDLLLFRGFELPSRLQRCCTRAEYDHVAVLLKDEQRGILELYEATQKEKCLKKRWEKFNIFSWNLEYENLVYRELIVEKPSSSKKHNKKKQSGVNKEVLPLKSKVSFENIAEEERRIPTEQKQLNEDKEQGNIENINHGKKLIEDVDLYEEKLTKISKDLFQFQDNTERKGYFLSLCDMCCFKPPQEYEVKKNFKESQGFFCSSLVAAAYMYADILPTCKTSGNYLPGHFQQENILELNQGYLLGPETIIDFTM